MPQIGPMAWTKLERDSPQPLQVQIVNWLSSLILSGKIAPRTRLPPEASFMERLGVSRITVRLAFDELVARGLVVRSHGRGSFVAASLVRHDLQSDQAFFDIVLSQAAQPEARLLAFAPALPPPSVARQFGLAAGQTAMLFERLYLSGGQPVAFASGWLTPDANGLSRADIERRSTASLHVDVLRHPVVSAVTAMTAEAASAPVARQLGVRPRSAVLVLVRSRFDARRALREVLRFTVDPSSHEFTLSADSATHAGAVLRAVAA